MPVILSRHGQIAEINLDWPQVHNALGPAEAADLRRAFEGLKADDNPPAVVLLTASGKSFSAGGNLKAISDLVRAGPEVVRNTIYGEFQGLFRAIAQSPAPVIAAVQGGAIGLGCDLALAADVVFVGPKGWLKQGWINAGLVPATGGTRLVVRRAGSQALWRFIAADRIGPDECDKIGLGYSVPDAREAALKMAQELAALPYGAIQATRKLSRIDDREEHLRVALEYQVGFLSSPEFAKRARELLDSNRSD